MRDERRKKEASKVKQTTRQSNTAHPRQSLFLRKMSCLRWDSNPRHSTLVLSCIYMYNYTSSGLKDCFMCEYLRNLAMGRMLEPVYIRMKKNTPVEKMRGSCGLSCEEERGKVLTPSLAHEWCGDRGWWSPHMSGAEIGDGGPHT